MRPESEGNMRAGVRLANSSDRRFLNAFRCVLALAVVSAAVAAVLAVSSVVGGLGR